MTIQGLLQEAIFEAPPATLSKVVAWATKIYAGHVLAITNAEIEKFAPTSVGGLDLSKFDKLLADHKKMLRSLPKMTRKMAAGEEFVLKVFGVGQLMGIKIKHYDPPEYVEIGRGFLRRGGRRLHYPKDDFHVFSIQDAEDYIREKIEDGIAGIETAKAKEKAYAERAQKDPRIAPHRDTSNLVELKAELEKYTDKPKQYSNKVSTIIETDVSGWKYLPDEQSMLDSWNQGSDRKRKTLLKKWGLKIDQAIKNFQWAQKNLVDKEEEEIEDLKPPPEARGYWDGERYYRDVMRYSRKFEPKIKYNIRPGGGSYSIMPVSQLQQDLENIQNKNSWEGLVSHLSKFKLVLDFKGHRRRSGQWSPHGADGHGEMQLDVWWRTPTTVKAWSRSLSLLAKIARHETKHLGQDILQSIKRLNQDAGLPSKHIMDPGYETGGHKTNRISGGRREHALRDVEFYTRLADSVTYFLHDVEDRGKETEGIDDEVFLKSYYKEGMIQWVRGDQENPPRSRFFRQLRKAWIEHQRVADKRKTAKAKSKAQDLADRYHRRYKKAVKEFIKAIREKGYTGV